MAPARRPCLLACAALAAAAVGAAGCGGSEDTGAAVPPTAIGALSAQGGRLLGGGPAAFRRQLAALRGHPVVVNQWASWCGPCRYEFPFFGRLAARYRGRVAFLGVNSNDSRDPARRFLAQRPVPYPSFFDPSASIARVFEGGAYWPTTAFYDAQGRRTKTHPGAYATERKLEQDVRRFALGA
jgi:thiol-disulfide isomerase/thioredoxin